MTWQWLKQFLAHPEAPPEADNEQIRLMQAYRDVFTGMQGERVLDDLMGLCRVASTTYIEGMEHATLMLQGRREVGMYIMEMVFGAMPRPVGETSGDYEPLDGKGGEEGG